MKNLLKYIFEIKNVNDKKRITILGISFYLSLNALIINIVHKLGLKQNTVVFSNYKGNDYGCNPKYITEEIIKRKLPIEIVWLVKKDINKKSFPSEVKLVPYNSTKAIIELARGKVWVDNYHKVQFIKKGLIKHPNQKYIQTWHGSLGIKKIEKNANCLNNDKEFIHCSEINSEITDYWISNSKFETDIYKNNFWKINKILEYGHPRNDVFFKDMREIKNKVYEYYGIDKSQKIVFYVPSFREDENIDCYSIDYEKILTALDDKFLGKYVFMTRLHPRVAKFSSSLLKDNKNVIDATQYPDIQELLVSADVVITDYSSCIFDFMLSRKPGFIFASDIDDFNTERGFYYPLESTPFPVARNNKELIENIKNFDIDKYKVQVEEFLKDKGCLEDGHASERVVDLIEEIILGRHNNDV